MAGKITAIKAQKKRKGRVSVFLDDEYAFSLQSTVAAGLRRGQELTEEDIQRLRQQDAAEAAYESALHYLSFRPRSECEIRRYLQRRGTDDPTIEHVLDRLRRAGLANDSEFVRFWVESREAHRPRSARALRAELRQKGVDDAEISQALDALDEEASALNAARQVIKRLAHLDQEAFHRRLLGYLQRRGFGYEISRKVTTHIWSEMVAQGETVFDKRAVPDTDI